MDTAILGLFAQLTSRKAKKVKTASLHKCTSFDRGLSEGTPLLSLSTIALDPTGVINRNICCFQNKLLFFKQINYLNVKSDSKYPPLVTFSSLDFTQIIQYERSSTCGSF